MVVDVLEHGCYIVRVMNDQSKLHTNSLTIDELIALLQQKKEEGIDGETLVMFSYNYGDHWGSRVCGEIQEAELLKVAYSDYHSMPKVSELDEDEDDKPKYDKEDEIVEVLILGK